MNKITDEILNRYIDGELSPKEAGELKRLIADDENAINLLRAHKYTDQLLKELEPEPAPDGISESVMARIFVFKPKIKPAGNSIVFIAGIFLTVLAVLIGMILTSGDNASGSNIAFGEEKLEQISDNALSAMQKFLAVFNNDIFLIGAASVTLILLVSAYFLFENHKNYRDSLDTLRKPPARI